MTTAFQSDAFDISTVWPTPDQVLLGVEYGPNGNDWTGTLATSGASPASIAAAVWAHVLEAGLSTEEVLRIIAAAVAGSATGLESGAPAFKGLDGSTTRVAGTYYGGTRAVTTLNGA